MKLPEEVLFHLREIYQEVVPDFMQRRNVVACGLGFKMQGNQITGTPGLIVSVERKEPEHALDSNQVIPQSINSVRTDVFETGPIIASGINRVSAIRPIRPGLSVGHVNGNIGTIGAIVRRGNQLFILSNNHVLALLNKGKSGDPILQPAVSDGGTAADTIAELADYIPLIFSDQAGTADGTAHSLPPAQAQGCLAQVLNLFTRPTTTPLPLPTMVEQPVSRSNSNRVDAALGRLLDQRMVSPSIVDIGGPPRGTAEAELQTPVVKSGRSSGLTQGTILQVDVTVNVTYQDEMALFTDQIMITPLSKPGDSGSLVLNHAREAVGLLFSGSDKVSIASPIDLVLEMLGVELVVE